MCGSIRMDAWSNKQPVTPDTFLPPEAKVFIQKRNSLQANLIPGNLVRWNGFSREETLADKFPRKTWMRGEVIIDGFNEKGKDYDVPKGHAVQAVFLKTQNEYQMNIITREARGLEQEVHSRFPRVTARKYTTGVGNSGGGGGKKVLEEDNVVRVCITGHRPKQVLKGDIYNWKNPGAVKIRKWLVKELLKVKEEAQGKGKEVIAACGMALGVDLWFAAVCVKLEIPFIAFLPCKNQEKLWGEEYKQIYKRAINKAVQVRYTTRKDYEGPKCILDRNTAMANWLAQKDDSVLFSVWDGSQRSGTGHMVNQSKKRNIKNINLDPKGLSGDD